MCMLTYLTEGTQPNPVALLNGAEYNDDGHGFAIVTSRKRNPIVRRYMDAEIAVSEFERMRVVFDDGPAMFHSRFGTAGIYGLFNTHPFRVDRKTVLAHNGVLPKRFQPVKKDNRCDTRKYADILRQKGMDLADPKVRNMIADQIGGHNKFVILSTRPGYEPGYIINEEAGHWVDGTWYSNLDFVGYPRGGYYVVGGKASTDTLTSEGACIYCFTDDVDELAGMCLTCDRCQECGSIYWDGCQCYPSYTSTSKGRPMALEGMVEM